MFQYANSLKGTFLFSMIRISVYEALNSGGIVLINENPNLKCAHATASEKYGTQLSKYAGTVCGPTEQFAKNAKALQIFFDRTFFD